jgi:hypothetical protein
MSAPVKRRHRPISVTAAAVAGAALFANATGALAYQTACTAVTLD